MSNRSKPEIQFPPSLYGTRRNSYKPFSKRHSPLYLLSMKSSIFMSTTFRHRTINQPRDQCKFVVPLASIAPPASRASDKTSSQECHQKQFITAIAMPSKIIALPNLLCAQRPLNPPKIESGPMRLTVSLPLCFPPWLVQVGANFEIRESPVNSSYDYIEKSPVSKFASTWASHSGKQE